MSRPKVKAPPRLQTKATLDEGPSMGAIAALCAIAMMALALGFALVVDRKAQDKAAPVCCEEER